MANSGADYTQHRHFLLKNLMLATGTDKQSRNMSVTMRIT